MDLNRRHYAKGLWAGLRWIINPVSTNGAAQVSRIQLSLGGPEILGAIGEMKRHPVGSRLLRDKPDLDSAFRMEHLATMPEGSFGRVYHDLMDHPDTVPGYLLAGLAYKDGFFDSVEMNDDTRWYLERHFFDHDASHVLSGYGTDLTGEALNIFFVIGHTSDLPRWAAFLSPFGVAPLLLSPKCGRRAWRRHLLNAFGRGRSARKHFPFHSIPYEELLPKPLAEVRALLGVDPLPEGWDTSDWLEHSRYARAMSTGFGQMEKSKADSKLAHRAIESGLPWRDYSRAPLEAQARVREIVARGGGVDEMETVLGQNSQRN